MALSNQKQGEMLNKIRNTSSQEEILPGLQTKGHSLQQSTLDKIGKRSIQRKRVSSVSKEDSQGKCIKISDEIEEKTIYTMSEEGGILWGKIKLLINERVDILNKDLDQKLESLNRRAEQGEWKKLEEKSTTILEKASKLERRIDAMTARLEELFSKMAIHRSEMKEGKCQVIDLTEDDHSCSKVSTSSSTAKDLSLSRAC